MTIKELKEQIEMALKATNLDDDYCVGMRNGFRWVLSCISGEEQKYEVTKKESFIDKILPHLVGAFIGLIVVALLKYIIGI